MKTKNNVTNYYKTIPKKYLKSNYENPLFKQNNIDNIVSRFLIIGPSGSGKTNNLLEFIKRTSGSYYHIYMCCKNPHQPLYEWLKDEMGDGITITDINIILYAESSEHLGLLETCSYTAF